MRLVQVHGRADAATLSEDDAVILECWAQFKEAGLSPDRGVGPAEFELYDSAMEQLVQARGTPGAARLLRRDRSTNCRGWSSRRARSSAGC